MIELIRYQSTPRAQPIARSTCMQQKNQQQIPHFNKTKVCGPPLRSISIVDYMQYADSAFYQCLLRRIRGAHGNKQDKLC